MYFEKKHVSHQSFVLASPINYQAQLNNLNLNCFNKNQKKLFNVVQIQYKNESQSKNNTTSYSKMVKNGGFKQYKKAQQLLNIMEERLKTQSPERKFSNPIRIQQYNNSQQKPSYLLDNAIKPIYIKTIQFNSGTEGDEDCSSEEKRKSFSLKQKIYPHLAENKYSFKIGYKQSNYKKYLNCEQFPMVQSALNQMVEDNSVIKQIKAYKQQSSLEKKLQVQKIDYQKKSQTPQLKRSLLQTKKYTANIKNNSSIDSGLLKLCRYREFLLILNFGNDINVQPPVIGYYKAIITKGNNGLLIKYALKSRWWWQTVENYGDYVGINLYWTQNRKKEFYEYIDNSVIQENQSTQNKEQNQLSQEIEIFCKLLTKQQMKEIKAYSKSQQDGLYFHQTISNETEIKPQITECSKILSNPLLLKVHNHLEKNYLICNKKSLFYNLKHYYEMIKIDPFTKMPLTFHVENGILDPQFQQFQKLYRKNSNNAWIIKPGENTNRGNGIQIFSQISEIRRFISDPTYWDRTYIIQQYIQNPLLFNKRKFDIRVFILVTCIKEKLKCYWYQEGYIRTSSKEFDLTQLESKFIHLTNDAVQCKGDEYGKYESGNKVSFSDFSSYLQNTKDVNFDEKIVPQLKQLSKDIISSVFLHLNPENRAYTFELLGLDFMLDNDCSPWLIEVNTNPCLETSCLLLKKLMPILLENVVQIAIDPMFPPPLKVINVNDINIQWSTSKKNNCQQNCLDSDEEGQYLIEQYGKELQVIQHFDDDIYEDY